MFSRGSRRQSKSLSLYAGLCVSNNSSLERIQRAVKEPSLLRRGPRRDRLHHVHRTNPVTRAPLQINPVRVRHYSGKLTLLALLTLRPPLQRDWRSGPGVGRCRFLAYDVIWFLPDGSPFLRFSQPDSSGTASENRRSASTGIRGALRAPRHYGQAIREAGTK
jgi:hypothetical protein